MPEQPTLAQGLTAFLTPLATVGASAYTTQTKAQVNAARIKAGKEPCTGQYGQPPDCPAMFAPGAPAETPGASPEQQGGGGYPPPSSGISPMVIVILLAGAGLVIFLLMSSKKSPATPKRKKSRRK